MPRVKGSANREATTSIFADKITRKPPQCRAMHCVRDKHVMTKADCCYFCPQKYACEWPCMNFPTACGMVVVPRKNKKGGGT